MENKIDIDEIAKFMVDQDEFKEDALNIASRIGEFYVLYGDVGIMVVEKMVGLLVEDGLDLIDKSK